MKKNQALWLTLLSLFALMYCGKDGLWDTTVPETEDDATASEIEGFIFRPASVDATDERVSRLKLPAGFSVSKYFETKVHPRILAVSEQGFVYYSDREAGTVSLITDPDKDGKGNAVTVVATLEGAHGLAIRNNNMYIATVREIYRAAINGDGTLGTPALLYDKLPDGGQHPNRTIGFDPAGNMYVSVGSTCNSCAETNPMNATIVRFDPSGNDPKIFASGLRNTIGFGWHPATGQLWGMDHGIDWLGDNQQHEELNAISDGKFFGWPYIYDDGKYNPGTRPPADSTYQQYLQKTVLPSLMYNAHAAPMQMAFYNKDQFGDAYRNNAFIAMRGSWNRSKPSGYEIVRVVFENGQPTKFESFVSGFLVDNNRSQFARLVGVAVHPDGSLLFCDDSNGVVYRVIKI